jgi:hypothetical protein
MQPRSLQQVRVSVSLIFLIHGLIIATWLVKAKVNRSASKTSKIGRVER